MTFKSATFARFVRISSWIPSAKNAVSWFALRLSNGNTAMLLAGTWAGVFAPLAIMGAAGSGSF